MSARKPRWEVVRTAAGFHARFRSSNGAILVSSETYERRRDAVRCIAVVGDAPRYSDGKDADLIEVRDIDERPEPVVPVIVPPYYLTSTVLGTDWWHDSDMHWRNCTGEDCEEDTPPPGTKVSGRFGVVEVTP